MTITGTLYDCTLSVLSRVISVGYLTGKRVISLTVGRHVGHTNYGHRIQCSGPAASDSNPAQESGA
jgi:hypothetical protein